MKKKKTAGVLTAAGLAVVVTAMTMGSPATATTPITGTIEIGIPAANILAGNGSYSTAKGSATYTITTGTSGLHNVTYSNFTGGLTPADMASANPLWMWKAPGMTYGLTSRQVSADGTRQVIHRPVDGDGKFALNGRWQKVNNNKWIYLR